VSDSSHPEGRPARHGRRLALGLLLGLAALALGWGAMARPRARLGPLAAAALVGATAPHAERRGRPNRLIHEKSPYLLQHAHNPVDWYPWGEEAFARARAEGKPIFLSIGYSTCHWCHVMERESFEDEAVAELLNRDFVAIKVDREERPDVDRIYMTAMQAMGMGGGWPLNVFLTPALEPFFGGTYFPPDSMPGRPGMRQILPRVAEAWRERRSEIEATGARVLEALAGLDRPEGQGMGRAPLLEAAYRALAGSFDEQHGGFGIEPKFPSVVNLNFLLRVPVSGEQRAHAIAMVRRQLDAMRAGGIHDQLGGGFHRYATDRAWMVPHFEKMLYDQAQLAWAYLDGYQVTGEPSYAEAARGIFGYVARDLTSPEGAFWSAEDADSEGEEGRFYVWKPAEIEALLGAEDARLFAARYGVTEAGNFEHGATILHEARSVEDAARAVGMPVAEARARLETSRGRLLDARSRRVRPHRDDKVITAWNGLMISAYARGARVLGEPELATRAARAAEFVWSRLRDPSKPAGGALLRVWREGAVGGAGQLDDHAYLALGFLDLYAATFEPLWLERAQELTEAQIARFWDPEHGAFFESPAGDASIRLRMKDGFDGAEIAGNSIAASNLLVLAALLDRREWRSMAERTLDYHAARIADHPAAMPQMLVAVARAAAPARHLVIAGRRDAPDTRALLAQLDRRFLPFDQLLLVEGGERGRRLAALAPFTAALKAPGGRATAYLCVDYACRLPTSDPAALAAQLDEAQARRDLAHETK
jgi:uncharacterized protein